MFGQNNDPAVYFQLGLFLSSGSEHLHFSVGTLATINPAGADNATLVKRHEPKQAKCEPYRSEFVNLCFPVKCYLWDTMPYTKILPHECAIRPLTIGVGVFFSKESLINYSHF